MYIWAHLTAAAVSLTLPAPQTTAGCSLEQVYVRPNQTYLFRLINAGSLVPISVCFEGHNVTIIAADAVPVEPLAAQCVEVNLGQRYDVLLKTDQAPGQYWITGLPQYRKGSPNGYAVLRYTGTPVQLPPTPAPQPGSVAPWTQSDFDQVRRGQDSWRACLQRVSWLSPPCALNTAMQILLNLQIRMSDALLAYSPPRGSVYATAAAPVRDCRCRPALRGPLTKQPNRLPLTASSHIPLYTGS